MAAYPKLLIVLAIHVLACRPGEPSSPSSMEQRFDALVRVEWKTHGLPERARHAATVAAYDEMAAPVRTLDRISDHDLELLYRGAQRASFYTHDPRIIQGMASYLNSLQERGLASKDHYLQMYEAFIGARMLTEARALAKQHPMPELEVLPELHEAADVVPGRPTEWVVDPNKRELLRKSVDLQSVQVVVVSHPLCHFSQRAMRDIQADPVLREIFLAKVKWMAPQSNHLDFDVIQQWNREHPGQETTLTFRRDEWPMIDSWATPTFYILKNGAVSAKVEGWPKEGRRSELLGALRQVGLLK
jgi:hypothetical protein